MVDKNYEENKFYSELEKMKEKMFREISKGNQIIIRKSADKYKMESTILIKKRTVHT